MNKYAKQIRMLVAIDCVVLGYDGDQLKILLVQRHLEPQLGNWSLMGGFIQPKESIEQAADRVLELLTGLHDIYLEQLHVYSLPDRDPLERTISAAFFALLDLSRFSPTLSEEYHAEWFPLTKFPNLIFDHNLMVEKAKNKLRYKAALHPILFELLPEKFTLPQLQLLFEQVFDTPFDKRNFSRKMLSTELLIRLNEKDKQGSKKGAYLYMLDNKNYKKNFHNILHLIPNLNLHV